MHTRNSRSIEDVSLLDEPADDEPVDPLEVFPELERPVVRRALDDSADESVGMRSVLERPDALSRLWRRLNTT